MWRKLLSKPVLDIQLCEITTTNIKSHALLPDCSPFLHLQPSASLDRPSQQISILRVQIAQLRLFILGETEIPWCSVSIPVLEPADKVIEHAGDYADNSKGEADAVASNVFRSVGFEKHVDGYDACCEQS